VGDHSEDRQQHFFPTTKGADRSDVMTTAVRQWLAMAMAEIDQIGTGRRLLPQPLRCRGGLNIAHVKLLGIAYFVSQQHSGQRALDRAKRPLQSGLKVLGAMIGERAYLKK
jgi:hypothetical protein